MNKFKQEELSDALGVLSSLIKQSEKHLSKFSEHSSQHTLLKNRIKAMSISKVLITNECPTKTYSKEELNAALSPINSLQSKCEKAILKFSKGTAHYNRLNHIIKAMDVSKVLIMDEMNELTKNIRSLDQLL